MGAVEEMGERTNPNPQPMVIVAPRGYGKTALLDKFNAESAASIPVGSRVVCTTASQIRTPDELIAVIAGDESGGYETTEGGSVSIAGMGLGHSVSRRVSVERFLVSELKQRPTVIVVDEAGELRPEPGQVLLNAAQTVSKSRHPLMFVLAGTPKMWTSLARASATFCDRYPPKPLALLSGEESADTIVGPMREAGVDIGPDALQEVVREAQGYPFFLQTWGKALYGHVSRHRASRIDSLTVRRVHPVVRRAIAGQYATRTRELAADENLLGAAVAVAQLFGSDDEPRNFGEITKAIRSGASAGEDTAATLIPDIRERLHSLGFVWETLEDPDRDCWRPGIPSLMTHVLSRHRDRSGREPRCVS